MTAHPSVQTHYLADYRAPDYKVHSVTLDFDLGEAHTLVTSELEISANFPVTDARPLMLFGAELELISVALDGRVLSAADYVCNDVSLVFAKAPRQFRLRIVTKIYPQQNTTLNGLYRSSGNFCTQCEPEGFRRITYYLDRPDVMSVFTVTLHADKKHYPHLLCNGNPVAAGGGADGKHWVRWHDPYPKPSYLFALVAGDLACIEDEFVTMSGRRAALRVYVQHHNADQCAHAMRSLKNSMRWDEEVYGREYDLDIYMIVAVDDFNMGAMENKGLNIFNSKYVLAKQETATDADFQHIEGVIGHEYFHNWSGNRVTCRDWFQLSLKEGFTVYRDQEFSADMGSRGVKRIADVNVLRTHQFREDAGPMAHPVRPESYVEINNFYTMTVYNKGAEVVRMLAYILGPAGFRGGTDLYFSRHDGQAVTTDDFVRALEDANQMDLSQFKFWYKQAGTPVLNVSRRYDAQARTYALTIEQSCAPSSGQASKQPFHIPIAMALLDREGRELPLRLRGEAESAGTSRVLQLREAVQTFVFDEVEHPPLPSLLRGFSAPVKLNIDFDDAERMFLLAHDSDEFNRWESGQRLALKLILDVMENVKSGTPLTMNNAYVSAMRRVLSDRDLDRAMMAQILTLPAEGYIAEFTDSIDPGAIHHACRFVRTALARELADLCAAWYEELTDAGPYKIDADAVGRRALRNVCLGYMMELDDPAIRTRCVAQYRDANNMTDMLNALYFLCNTAGAERDQVLADFYQRWQGEALVVDKWLSLQAGSRLEDTVQRVHTLTSHPAFNIKNPNKVRALVGAFSGNTVRFHDQSGAGYALVADYVLQLNTLNPQIAARLVSAFTLWRKYEPTRSRLMEAQLKRIAAVEALSKDVYEIVNKSLTAEY
ncbi:MAG: aminopeptidase N [Pseudomonadota bacterium]